MTSMDPESQLERLYTSSSAEQTEQIGECLGRALPAGSVLALEGELGTGKTCLVRGLARGLGIEDSVASPTYLLMQATEGGRLPLYHFDAWMEGRELDLLEDGGGEWLEAGGVAVVEWASKVEKWLPSTRIELCLGHIDPETRSISLRLIGDAQSELGKQLAAVIAGLPGQLGSAEEAPAKPQYRPLHDCGRGMESPKFKQRSRSK